MEALNHLWSFVQAARCGSFSAAAAHLAVSAGAVSKSIARLERHLGTKLFVRTTRTLHLTSEGQVLFDRVGPSFSDIDEAMHEAQHASGEPVGQVRLSTVTSYGRYLVVPLLPEFFQRHPMIDLRISFHDGGRGLSRQAFDVRINWGEERENDKVAKRLCRLPLVLVASPAYLHAHGAPKEPRELEQHQCITVGLPGIDRAHWVFTRRKTGRSPAGDPVVVHPKGRLVVVDELDAVSDAALAGLGLTVTSMVNVTPQLRDGSLVRVLPDYDIEGNTANHSEVIMQYPQRKHLAPRVRLLVDFLLERLVGREESLALLSDRLLMREAPGQRR